MDDDLPPPFDPAELPQFSTIDMDSLDPQPLDFGDPAFFSEPSDFTSLAERPFILTCPPEYPVPMLSNSIEKVRLHLAYERKQKGPDASPRHRANFSDAVKTTLKKWFNEKSKKPSYRELDFLAEATGLSHRQLRTWFTNMRMRTKPPKVSTSVTFD